MPLHDRPHREMAEFISDLVTSNKLLLVPRDCWKTSLGSQAFPLWMVLRAHFLDGNPAYRCLIDSSTTRLSTYALAWIKSKVQHEDKFKETFGELYDRKGDRQDGFSLKFRVNAAVGVKEPNFVSSGVNAAKTGLHFELMVLDDLVTKENCRTVDQRTKVWDHYRMMQAILESGTGTSSTIVLVTGTRYHDDDIYGRIIKLDKQIVAEGKPPVYSALIRSAVTEDGYYFPGEACTPGCGFGCKDSHKEHDKPGNLNKETIDKKKITMGSLFWAQMMNDPNSEDAPFKAKQLRFKPIMDFPPQLSRIRLTIDPAVKAEEVSHGDFTCMVVAGWDRWHQPHVLDVSLRDNLTPGKFIEEMFHLASKWSVEHVLIEDDRSMTAMSILWKQEFQKRGYSFPVHLIPANKLQGKLTRWLDLQPYAERGGIVIAEEIPAAVKIEIMDQWSRAPFATHDDFMDAMSMQTLFLPVQFSEDSARSIVTAADLTNIHELATHPPPKSNSPFHGSMADRFPHLLAQQYAESNIDMDEDFSASLEAIGV